jgi:hypothetical protein
VNPHDVTFSRYRDVDYTFSPLHTCCKDACRKKTGLRKLQDLLVGMFQFDDEKRLTALDVTQRLNEILCEFPTML